MSFLEEYETYEMDELEDVFSENLKHQSTVKAYPEQFLAIRKLLVQWIASICKKYAFKAETLHRTVSLFDMLIVETKMEEDKVDINDIKLTIVACLSLSTKLNEHNANYVQFFTENILNASPTLQTPYSVSDLALKELEIPILINYNVNSPNTYHFNSIFLRICLKHFSTNQMKEDLVFLNQQILTEFIATNYCVRMSSLNSAIIVLNETLRQFISESNSLTQAAIIKIIQSLIEDNKALNKTFLSSKNDDQHYQGSYCLSNHLL